jgi:integrase
MKKIAFPFEVKRGSVSVKIYRTPSNGCDSYTLAYYQNGVRKRPTFSSFQAANDEAEIVATRLGNADADILTLTSADRAAYLRARQLLDGVGAHIENAAAQFVQAKQLLGDVPLLQAAEYYVKRHPSRIAPRPVMEVVDEMLKLKQSDGLSEGYLRHLRYDLEKFAGAFHGNIGTVMGPEIDKWLRGLGVSPRTRNNLRNSVQTLFAFAKSQKYLPKDHDEIDGVTRAKDGAGEIEIFTPKEMAEILAHADERVVPFLTLGAFAGIRHAEIQRLDWNDIHFDASIIEIRAAKAKTASRRTLPILDNLRAWLLRHHQESGPVCVYLNMASEIESLVRGINEARRSVWAKAKGASGEQLKQAEKQARQALMKAKAERGKPKHRGDVPPGAETAQIEGWPAFAWKHNALRHSFISYRVADIQNVAQVALEAGNSPQMIFKHYRELVRPAEAKAWFAIEPNKNIVSAKASPGL